MTYQSRSLIGACLDSLHQPSVAVEAIVVDNGSTDGTAEYVRREYPETLLTTSATNLGFAAAVNLGAAKATGTYLLLLNPDAELKPETVARLVAYLEEHPRAAVASPRLIFEDGSPQDAAFRYPSLLMTWFEFFPHPARLLHTRWNGRLDARNGQPVEIDHPLGACMLIRRAAWNMIGPLDEGFFMYCEEVDWCMRAKRAGWTIVQVPTAVASHHGGASAALNPSSLIYLYVSRRRLHRKHRGRVFRVLAGLITRIGLVQERRRLRNTQPTSTAEAISRQERLQAVERILQQTVA